jgi:Mo-co oxidoreductase dimerisation domain
MEDGMEHEGTITAEELQLATRNHGMPLEALRWSVTPVGLHYVLVHYDIPHVVGRHTIEGRAWSGWGEVEVVDVSADDGKHWHSAEIDAAADGDQWAWRRWHWQWDAAEPGEHVLCCRAHDSAGNMQPVGDRWNFHGYANNAVQRVPVTVQS